MEETSIVKSGDFSGPLARSLDAALGDALALTSKLPDRVLSQIGMSGRLYRRLVNQLVSRIEKPRYLEVGSWGGSTACSAMYGNTLDITCIDNWSEFSNHMSVENPRDTFNAAVEFSISDRVELSVIENDFRKVDFGDLGKSNIYLFDGPHAYQDQLDGIVLAQPALDDTYVQIVDDWNWPYVRSGTMDALKAAGLSIECSIEVRSTQDDTHPVLAVMQESAWHNGYFIAVVKRQT